MNKQEDRTIARKYLSKINNANTRGIEFSLSFTAFKNLMRAKKCYYTGIALTQSVGGEGTKSTDRTIDRVDNTKGYVLANNPEKYFVPEVSDYIEEHLEDALLDYIEEGLINDV